MTHERKWRRANWLLLILIVLVNGYIIAVPFLPQLSFWFRERNGSQAKSLEIKVANEAKSQASSPQPNAIIIPKIMLDTPIVEGAADQGQANLAKGAWHLPFSKTPNQPGNTVIASHRFAYNGPGQGHFYFLNKLEPGDEIGVRWENIMHRYKVESVTTVPPTAVQIQEQDGSDKLTLYTCTPLVNPVNRLVVVARPVYPIKEPTQDKTSSEQLTQPRTENQL